MVLAGAYAGEVIRVETGGGWCYEPEATVVQPIYLALPDGGKVNVLAKVAKFLALGPRESVAMLVARVIKMARGS
jgi:hypothetical protein